MITAELAWRAIEGYYKNNRNGHCKEIKFNRTVKDSFIKMYKDNYDAILETYMDESVEALDRHKQSAILIHCTIACKIFTPSRPLNEDEIFIGAQQIALMLGLSYMRDCLNDILQKNGMKTVDHYKFPVAFSCSTEYFDILTRDLYLQSHKDNSVYILFLAHVLFFIEYITLKDHGIDDSVLREWDKVKI